MKKKIMIILAAMITATATYAGDGNKDKNPKKSATTECCQPHCCTPAPTNCCSKPEKSNEKKKEGCCDNSGCPAADKNCK